MSAPAPRIRAFGPIAASAVVWRLNGGLRVSIAVKATFTLVPGGAAQLTSPIDLARHDVCFERDPAQSVERASDLVPFRPEADVTFVGHAHAPPGRVVPAMSVRLAVYRDRPLVDRTLHVIGDRAPGAAEPAPFARMPIRWERAARSAANPLGRAQPNLVDPADPAHPAAFGPLATRALPAADILEIPSDVAWEVFQAAPRAQRAPYLRGDEWIVLDGLHPALARVSTQLPGARGVARVFLEGKSRDVELSADTLAIDGDAQTACVVWRGRFALASPAALSTLWIAAGLAIPGQPLIWPDAPEAAPLPRVVTAPAHLLSTAGIDEAVHAALASLPAVPFSPDAPSELRPSTLPAVVRAPAHLSGTAGLSFGEHASVAQRPATPFDAPRSTPIAATEEAAPAPPPEPPAPPPPRPRAAPPAEVPPRRTPAIPVFNRTPFHLVTLPWQVSPPRDSLTVLVKGTFDLVPGGPARARAEAELPSGDVHEGGDLDKGLVHSTDFAIHKPRADVLLTGRAHGGAIGITEVAFSFGHADNRFERRIAVFGERTWQTSFGLSSPSAPRPFDSLPLVWERAFGGPRCEDNPLGVGHAASASGEPARLPNLEDPLAPLASPRDTPAPVCFAPIPPSWRERRIKLGTYDRGWLKGRWPYFPEDFEWSHFQAAPRAQQLAHLAGDEPFEIRGMRREHPTLRGTLPAIRVRVVLAETREAGGALREITLRLDTASFDVEEMKLTLVWRGVIEVSNDEAPEIAALLLLHEEMSAPPATLEQVRDACLAADLPVAEVAPEPPANDEPRAIDPEEAKLRADLDARLQDARVKLDAAGIRMPDPDPAAEPPPVTLPDPAAIGASLRGAGMDEKQVSGIEDALRAAKAAAEATGEPAEHDLRALVIAKLEANEPLDGMDLTGADLTGLDLGGRSLAGARLLRAKLEGSNLAGADLSGAQLGEAKLARANLDTANLTGADLHGADLEKATFEGARIEGASFAGARGEGASFRGAKGASASFADGVWRRARFDEAELPSADFSRATLDGASFARAKLPEIRLYEARGAGVHFDGAKLDEARADEVSLPEATFHGAEAARSIWEKAVLDGASFRGAELPQASFVRASAAGAIFSAADLTSSRWARAKLAGAQFLKANLMKASFERADLTRADLRGANLYQAETWKAKLDGAALELAIVDKTKLEGRT